MTTLLSYKITSQSEKLKELEKEVERVKADLMNLGTLTTIARRLPSYLTLTECSDSDNDDKVIRDAMQEAEDDLRKPREERKPIHFFMGVNKDDGRIDGIRRDSYDVCYRYINTQWRVGEFIEVMPDNHVDNDYFWRNIYRARDGSEFRVGLPSASLDEATASISKKDSEDYFDTVRIRRNKKC